MPTRDQRSVTVPGDILERVEPILERRRRPRTSMCVAIARSYTFGEFDPNRVTLPRYMTETRRGWSVKPFQYRLDDDAFAEFARALEANARRGKLHCAATGEPWTESHVLAAGLQLVTYESWPSLPF